MSVSAGSPDQANWEIDLPQDAGSGKCHPLLHVPPDQFHSDRSRGAAQPRHGAAAEPWAVPAAGHARTRHRGGRFHAGDRGPEYRLGSVAGAGRGDRRPLRSARDDARRGRHLRDRDGGHGGAVGRGAAAGLRRADRRCAVLHGLVAGADGGGPRGSRGAPQQDAGPRLGRRLARHADGAADDAEPAGEPCLADRRAVFRRAGRADDPGRVPGRRRRQDPGGRRRQGLDARDGRAGDAASPVSGDVGRLFRLRAEPGVSRRRTCRPIWRCAGRTRC